MKELPEIVRRLSRPSGFPVVLATLVKAEGSSYRRPGARALLDANGGKVGSISGGCLEDDVVLHARAVLATGISKTVVYDTTEENDLVWGVGLGCHGIVRVFLERLTVFPEWAATVAQNQVHRRDTTLAVRYGATSPDDRRTAVALPSDLAESGKGLLVEVIPPVISLNIFGAGDDARPLVLLAKEMGWDVSVIDPRSAYATVGRFPLADRVIHASTDKAAAAVRCDSQTASVIMTHHYVHDLPLLRALLPSPSFYLGLLGPKKRSEKLLHDLGASGTVVSNEERARLHSPVGLDLGGDSPESVALAVVAEIQAVHSGRTARPLRERLQPIHR